MTGSQIMVYRDDYSQFMHADVEKPCMMCGGLTRWAHWEFMTFVHPGLCVERLWREYEEATYGQKELRDVWNEEPEDWST